MRLTSHLNLEVTAGEQFVDADLELARQFIPSLFPVPTKAPLIKRTNLRPPSRGS